jgi:hypothetical protein
MAILRTCVLATVSAMGAAVFEIAPIASPTAAAEHRSARAPGEKAGVVVVSANLREGSRVRRASDMRNGDDVRRFANRVLSRGARMPDVLLLQEVLGSAERVVRALNQHRRARSGATRASRWWRHRVGGRAGNVTARAHGGTESSATARSWSTGSGSGTCTSEAGCAPRRAGSGNAAAPSIRGRC